MVDESTLKLTVKLHGTTQTRCIVVPKAKGDALITINNISCCFFRSFTIVVEKYNGRRLVKCLSRFSTFGVLYLVLDHFVSSNFFKQTQVVRSLS